MKSDPIILKGRRNYRIYRLLDLGIPRTDDHSISYRETDEGIIILAKVGDHSVRIFTAENGTLVINDSVDNVKNTLENCIGFMRTLTIQRKFQGASPVLSRESTISSILTKYRDSSFSGNKQESIRDGHSLIISWHILTGLVLHEIRELLPKQPLSEPADPYAFLNSTSGNSVRIFTRTLRRLYSSAWRRITGSLEKKPNRPAPEGLTRYPLRQPQGLKLPPPDN